MNKCSSFRLIIIFPLLNIVSKNTITYIITLIKV
jgi:hypothetical protein